MIGQLVGRPRPWAVSCVMAVLTLLQPAWTAAEDALPVSQRELDVYAAWLRQSRVHQAADFVRIHSRVGPHALEVRGYDVREALRGAQGLLPKLKPETLEAFVAANRHPARLGYRQRKAIARAAGKAPKLLPRRPHGERVTFSRVGFDPQGSQALVFVYADFRGVFHVLARRDGRWKVVDSGMVWIS